MKRNLLCAVIVVLALAGAACSSDDSDSTEATSESTEATSEATEDPTEEAAEEPSDEATDEPAEEPTEEETPEALPASFRGVTEDTIKVGVVVPDFDALQAAGITNYRGDAGVAFQPFIDQINADGGIFGRQIEPVYVSFDYLSPVTQEEACTQLTEDEEVFIVLHGLLAQNNLCLTDLHDTMVMTETFQTSQMRDESGDTVWLQLNASDDERSAIMVEVLAETGMLDGTTIGVLAGATTGEGGDGDVVQATLSELGYESQLVVIPEVGDDAVARDNEAAIATQSFIANGVDFVFDLTSGGFAAEAMRREGYDGQIAFKVLGAAVDGVSDPAVLDGTISVAERDESVYFEDPDFIENCMEVVRAANPDLEEEMSFIPSGEQQADGEPNWIPPIMVACDQTRLLQAVAEIAGADLTNESFRAALDELGPFELYGFGLASFGSESKWDGLDEFYIQEYDADAGQIVIGDPIIIDRS